MGIGSSTKWKETSSAQMGMHCKIQGYGYIERYKAKESTHTYGVDYS
jgi:hypothetical protein